MLCRKILSLTYGEDAEWLEEDEVPTDVPDEEPSTVTDELPIIADWESWLANPLSPED